MVRNLGTHVDGGKRHLYTVHVYTVSVDRLPRFLEYVVNVAYNTT
jgi:hypothetical protein